MRWIRRRIENIREYFFMEETLNLFKKLYYIVVEKKIIVWFLFLPLTLFLLILNLIVFFISYFFYLILFFKKKKEAKKSLKPKVLKFKKRFLFLENIVIINLKNILIEYPKARAFLSFYYMLKKIKDYKSTKSEEKKEFIKKIVKIILNRYFILFIFGLPYLLLYCNTRFVNRFFDIYEFKKEQKAGVMSFFLTLSLNIGRDLSPFFIYFIEKFKIKFYKKKIILNPNKKGLNEEILKNLKKTNFLKQVEILKERSFIDICENKIKEVKNNDNIIIKTIKSKPHIETYFKINEKKLISINETSKPFLNNNLESTENKKIENYYYGGCTYKLGDCYITKPILTEREYKSFLKESVNYKIKNIDLDKVNYNQILAVLLNLNESYIEAKFVENKNEIRYYYEENKNNLWSIIEANKENMKKDTYEAIKNANEFIKKVDDLNENLKVNEKILLINKSLNYNLIKDNDALFQILKLK